MGAQGWEHGSSAEEGGRRKFRRLCAPFKLLVEAKLNVVVPVPVRGGLQASPDLLLLHRLLNLFFSPPVFVRSRRHAAVGGTSQAR